MVLAVAACYDQCPKVFISALMHASPSSLQPSSVGYDPRRSHGLEEIVFEIEICVDFLVGGDIISVAIFYADVSKSFYRHPIKLTQVLPNASLR